MKRAGRDPPKNMWTGEEEGVMCEKGRQTIPRGIWGWVLRPDVPAEEILSVLPRTARRAQRNSQGWKGKRPNGAFSTGMDGLKAAWGCWEGWAQPVPGPWPSPPVLV